MTRILTIFFFIAISILSFGGEGVWRTHLPLSSLVVNQEYIIKDRSHLGEDVREQSSYKGFVYLDYERKTMTDKVLAPIVWRATVTFEYTHSGITYTQSLQIGTENEARPIYTDYVEVPANALISEGYKIKVKTIKGEIFSGGVWTAVSLSSNNIFNKDVFLRTELRSERTYKLDVSTLGSDLINLNFDGNTFLAKWQPLSGAEEYDLEWVFIDSESKEHSTLTSIFSSGSQLTAGAYVTPFTLKEPSRVRTRQTTYQLDKAYPQGTLYFRVRAISNFVESGNLTDQIKTGNWSYFYTASSYGGNITAGSIVRYVINTGFEVDKNWLYGISWAEDGKNVSSISFYDGSNRGRQSLTYNTSDDLTLISENKFDFEGRSVISVIPSPVLGRDLLYHPLFNRNMANGEFNELNFDISNPEALNSNPSGVSPGLTGSAQYFSIYNPFTNDPFRDAIPDAGGYVYNQTIYRNDGTGRIERIGGIGPEFKATGDKAIRTFYGSPTSLELKRLFGDNVPDNLNGYRKEMVQDANGQLSVSYYDKRGNVIATGLSGNSPTNLIALEDQQEIEVYTPLGNNVAVDPYTMVSENTFMNAIPNNLIKLNYNLSGSIQQLNNQTLNVSGHTFTIGSLCATCRYDLTIEVINSEGQSVGATPVTQSIDPTLPCDEQGTASSYTLPQLSITLPTIGEYRIIKTLRVDTESMTAAFENQLTALQSEMYSTFESSYISNIDISGCFNTCDEYCAAAVRVDYNMEHGAGSWEALSTGQQQVLIDDCIENACNIDEAFDGFVDPEDGDGSEIPEITQCDAMVERMIGQIMPGGFLYDNLSSSFWNSMPNSVTINGQSFSKTSLQNPTNYSREKAEALIEYHRESCHLLTCSKWDDSFQYSSRLTVVMNQVAWNPANALYSTPFATTVLGGLTEDPFISSPFNTAFLTALNNFQYRVNNYLTQHPNPNFSSNVGNLAAYTVQLVNLLNNQNTASNPSSPYSAAQLESMHKTVFKGIYDHIKETIIYEYKTSIGCLYFLDNESVFKRVMTQAEMEDQIASGMSNIFNPANCEQKAFTNAQNWIFQLPASCVEELINQSLHIDGFTLTDLETNNIPGSIEQLFYNYSMATCPQNTWGWFYNPGVGNPGFTEYNNIKSLLTSACNGMDTWPTSFEVDPPVVITSTIINQNFPDCFVLFVDEILNAGIYFLDNYPGTCPIPNSGCSYAEMGVTLSTFPNFYNTCGYGDGVLAITNDNGKYMFHFTSRYFDCNKYLNLQYWDGNHVYLTSVPLISISNPRKEIIGGANVVVFDVMFQNGETSFAFIDARDLTCFQIGDFETQTITDFSFNYEINEDGYQDDCIQLANGQGAINAQIIFNEVLTEIKNQFAQKMAQCMANTQETFSMTYSLKEYQYTLYYYDLANNLVQTVPPQGVQILSSAQVQSNVQPIHKMETRYAYNGLNGMVSQFTPDGGQTTFFYDKLYRVRFSQNARQVVEQKASYSKYDNLGRIKEAGEFRFTGSNLYDPLYTEDNNFPSSNILDYTKTFYEEGYTADATIASQFTGGEQLNLRNSIGAIMHRQGDYSAAGVLIAGSEVISVISYSYDPHKNVKELVSTNNHLYKLNQQHKKTAYEYDLISGNVKEVIYQANKEDEYRHRYHYDANNRIIRAYTSNNNVMWERDAKYFYYLHGTLARTELGEDQIQGIDYAYNLQGWLKGVNSSTLKKERDLGKDALSTGKNLYFGMDAFGFNLGYYETDYSPIGNLDANPNNNITAFASTQQLQVLNGAHANLWNGNISHMVTAIRSHTDGTMLDVLGNNYKYDQLQRIKNMNVYSASGLLVNNNFNGVDLYRKAAVGGNAESAFQESYSYDMNGNITSLKRNGSGKTSTGTATAPLPMDNFTYHYYQSNSSTTIGTTPTETNRLAKVDDISGNTANYQGDIDAGQGVSNYQYDKSGQLIKDVQEGITSIEWTVTGKVKRIIFDATKNKQEIVFLYDPMDMRIAKIFYPDDTKTAWDVTYYVYDASGNPMATYERTTQKHATANYFTDALVLSEQMVYGSTRLGNHAPNFTLLTARANFTAGTSPKLNNTSSFSWTNMVAPSFDRSKRVVNDKFYELSNHLGNVLVVVSDRKKGTTDNGSSVYVPEIVSYSDYSPFGTQLHLRHGSSEAYRYGYQGSEMDNELKGEGNSYTTQFRILDPRIGRWLSIDPMAGQFPWQSPYCSMDNNPIRLNDQLGLESKDWIKKPNSKSIVWDEDVNSPGKAIAIHGTGTEYYAPGSVIGNAELNNSGKIGTVYLGENGSAGYLMGEAKVSAGQAFKIDDTQSFGFNLSSKVNPSNGYKVSDPLALEKSWMHDAPRFCNMMGYVANGAAMAPGLMMVLPSIYAAAPYVANGTVQMGRFTWSMANVYHKTFGMNGGYTEILNNLYDQSVSQLASNGNLNVGNYDLISLGTSSLLTRQSSFIKKIAQSHSSTLYSFTINNGSDGILVRKMSSTELLLKSAVATMAPIKPGAMPIVEKNLAPAMNGVLEKIFRNENE